MPAIEPIIMPLMGTVVGGGGRVVLSLNVTSRRLASCVADAGLRLLQDVGDTKPAWRPAAGARGNHPLAAGQMPARPN